MGRAGEGGEKERVVTRDDKRRNFRDDNDREIAREIAVPRSDVDGKPSCRNRGRNGRIAAGRSLTRLKVNLTRERHTSAMYG